MQQPSLGRILAAVELNPDRPRVTIRRDDARALLANHQRQAADVEHYKTAAIRLEAMCTQNCADIERLSRERDGLKALAEQRRVAAEPLIHPLALMPHAWVLYSLSAFAGFMAHG